MAGGKETPRQKMIGMMYLVLTALLALQVSNQILQKFILLNDGLERTSKNYIEKNASIVSNIEGTVEQQGNNEKDLPKVEAAKQIREKTSEIFSYLEGLKQELITQSNAKNDEGQYKNSALKNTDIAGNIFNNNKKGYEMQERLNRYPEEIGALLSGVGIPLEFEKIAKDANEIDMFKNDPDVRYKDFVNLNFVKSPIGAVLAIISQYQNEVLNIESESLGALTRSLGSFYYKADIFEPMVSANSNIVAAGTKFEGNLFIASASSSAQPKMSVNGKEIPVENGFGKISFPVGPADSYDDRGLAKRTLEGEVVVNIDGKDSLLNVNYEYFVANPTIEVTAEAIQQLYAQCANELSIKVPALGNSYAPEFAVTNGQAIKGSNPGDVTIIPANSGKVNIGVSSGGAKIGTVTYDIRPVPAPTIAAYNGDKEIDMSVPFPAPGPSQLKIKAVPEPTFGRTMPKDARFQVSGGVVKLLRNEVPREQVNINGEDVAIRQLLAAARSGDNLVIQVTEVTRTNFQGQKIKSNVNHIERIAIK
ncbi:gliding motility protein GldM [Echinicola vietnamensis]|uniref:Gliding motility-associated protein GldM n=1 Tax=Echinicola vietnamensis (strain DSM 17526 / LMG 23754 / KMM 6221) TaxID=926556 RepID=L0FSJ6_ECHVK|nr:gliding motility protein GldM [Echinicola vietnamensis]AGA76899.1 gliding motility-associated protein GldM [Echinicola vietnamensis DSM 17526]